MTALNNTNLEFAPTKIRLWGGRYGLIAGSTDHWKNIKIDGEWRSVVVCCIASHTLTCKAEKCDAMDKLTGAVTQGKKHLGGNGGGKFQINEFGQVIVPASSGNGMRVIVGEICGEIFLDNPFPKLGDDKLFRLWDDSDLAVGDPWDLPYVGLKYNLSNSHQIYYWHEENGKILPKKQDSRIIKSLREIRRSGAVRFIVNPYGIVLTKQPPDDEWCPEEKWCTTYVGKIQQHLWFNKEV